jgi:hypothetical protein
MDCHIIARLVTRDYANEIDGDVAPGVICDNLESSGLITFSQFGNEAVFNKDRRS